MKATRIDCGFIRLTDSAVLVAAQEMGFAAEERIDLALHREGNWSTIRDKVALGVYPVAHMLAPMAVALSLGLGRMKAGVDVPFVLNQNGNTLSAVPELAARIRGLGGTPTSAIATGRAIAEISRRQVLRIGVPFPQSMHLLLMRYFVAACRIDPARVTFTVAPPPVLANVLKAGEVDLVMVGEPWGSVAVDRGEAEIVLPGAAIWDAAPEKVLGVRRDWAEDAPEALRRLLRALYRAADWAGSAAAVPTLAEILALPRYLDVPADVIERALTGRLITPDGGLLEVPGALRIGGSAAYPWRSAGLWIGAHAAAPWGVARSKAMAAAGDCFRTDMFRQALAATGAEVPTQANRVEGAGGQAGRFFDGAQFDYAD